MRIAPILLLLFIIGVRAAEPEPPHRPPVVSPPLYAVDQVVSQPSKEGLPDTGQILVPLDSAEVYSLQKLKMQQELQGDLLSWAQTRLWIVAILSLAVGFFGVRSLVREMLASELKDATRASADAQAAATQGRDVVKELRTEAGKYREQVEHLTDTAGELNRQLQEIRSRIDAEGERAVAASDLKLDALNRQVSELSAVVHQLSQDTQAARDVARASEQRVAEVRKVAASKQADFASNSQLTVMVVHHGRDSGTEEVAKEIVKALSTEGFKAYDAPWTKDTPVHEEVEVDYKYQARGKAQVVSEIVNRVLASNGYPSQSKVSKPQTNDRANDIRVFM